MSPLTTALKASTLYVLLFLSLGLSPSLCAQTRFNIRYNSGYASTVFSSVVELENEFFVIGLLSEEGAPLVNPSVLAKFDNTGTLLFQKVMGGLDDHIFRATNPDLAVVDGTMLVYSGTTFDNENIGQAYVAWHNLEGDTLFVQREYHPDYPEADDPTIAMTYSQASSDGNRFWMYNYTNDGLVNQRRIEKRTAAGTLIWSQPLELSTPHQVGSYVTLPTNTGGCWVFPQFVQESIEGAKTHAIEFDLSGNTVTDVEIDLDHDIRPLGDVIEHNGAFLGATAIRIPGTYEVIPSLMKFMADGSVDWNHPAWEDQSDIMHTGLQVELATDGEGYLLGGTKRVGLEVPSDSSGTHDLRAFLTKFSLDGEVVWHREYMYLNVPLDDHQLSDLSTTSDGGYVFCGSASDLGFDTAPPYQQGWLVKVDEHGCLVEGCHLADNIEEVQDPTKGYFLAGPIPAQHTLNLALLQRLPQGSAFELYTASGALVDRFDTDHPAGTTLMLDTTNYPAGQYVVVLKVDGEGVQRMRVVVE